MGQVIDVKTGQSVEILGWTINPDKSKVKRILITVENDENLLVNTPVDLPCPDIAKSFKNPDLISSGWKAILNPSPEWKKQTITFKVWTYNPDTKVANFLKKFTLHFSSDSYTKSVYKNPQ